MEELIFFAVIIFFSIIDSVARSRRRARQGEAEEGAEEPEQFEWAQGEVSWDDEIPTYDDDPSYDDAVEEPSPRPSQRGERSLAPERDERNLAAEILAALGELSTEQSREPEASTRSLPRSSPPLPARRTGADRSTSLEPVSHDLGKPVGQRAPIGSRSSAPRRPAHEHYIHASHAGYGTDPSSRAPSEQDGLDPLAEYHDPSAAAVHRQLRSRSPDALRQAIILREVLGRPVSMREPGQGHLGPEL